MSLGKISPKIENTLFAHSYAHFFLQLQHPTNFKLRSVAPGFASCQYRDKHRYHSTQGYTNFTMTGENLERSNSPALPFDREGDNLGMSATMYTTQMHRCYDLRPEKDGFHRGELEALRREVENFQAEGEEAARAEERRGEESEKVTRVSLDDPRLR